MMLNTCKDEVRERKKTCGRKLSASLVRTTAVSSEFSALQGSENFSSV